MRPTKIMNRLNGCDRHFRGRFLLLHRKILSDSEFILWDLSFSALADWDDKNHDPKEYGSFNYLFKEIGHLLGWHESKVSRKAKKLISLGFWIKRDNRIFVSGFKMRDRFAQIAEKEKVIDLQQQFAILQPVIAKPQESDANLQEETPRESGSIPPQTHAVLQVPDSKASLSSYKNNSNGNGHRSDEEYQKIWDEDPNGMSIESMKQADEAMWETAGIGPHGEKRYATNKSY